MKGGNFLLKLFPFVLFLIFGHSLLLLSNNNQEADIFSTSEIAIISGGVTDQLQGGPLIGAQVIITNMETMQVEYTGVTDVNGLFSHNNGTAGVNYKVEISKGGYYSIDAAFVRADPYGQVFLNLITKADIFVDTHGAIAGEIRDANMQRLSGVQVNVYPVGGSTNYNTTTDDQGRFFVPELPTNFDYNVWPQKSGYSSVPSQELSPSSGHVEYKIFDLPGGPTNNNMKKFIVICDTSDELPPQPLVNAIVTIPGFGSKTTDSNGSTQLRNFPDGSSEATILKPGYSSVTTTFTINEPDTPIVSMERVDFGVIKVAVTDSAGNPIEGAETIHEPPDSMAMFNPPTKTTAFNGESVFYGQPTGHYDVTITHPEYSTAVTAAEVFINQLTQKNVVLRSKSTSNASLTGIARDMQNNPLADVNVEIKFGTDPALLSSTDSDGVFEFFEIPPKGNYTAKFSKQGYHTTTAVRSVKTEAGETTIKPVTLANKIEGKGALRILLSSPLDEIDKETIFALHYIEGDSTGTTVYPTINSYGNEIILTNIRPGVGILNIYFHAGKFIHMRVNVKDCHMLEIKLNSAFKTVSEKSFYTGNVKDQTTGEGLSSKNLVFLPDTTTAVLYKSDSDTIKTITNEEGQFFVDGLNPLSEYSVEISGENINTTVTNIMTLEENHGESVVLYTTLSQTGKGALTGTIVESGFLQQANVEIVGGISTTTLDDGSYLLNDINPGEYTLRMTIGEKSRDTLVTVTAGVTRQIDFGFINDNVNDIENESKFIPTEYMLMQNYPNPFNPSTQVNYSIPKEGVIKLTVFNVLGQLVTTLVDDYQKAGNYSIRFDTSNLNCSSGIYFYRLESKEFTTSRKMLLLK